MVSKQIVKEVRAFLSQSEFPFANKVVVSKAGIWTATKDISDIHDGAEFYTRATNDFTYGETLAAELVQRFPVTVEVLENNRTENTWTTKFTLTEVEQPAEPSAEPDAATVNGSQSAEPDAPVVEPEQPTEPAPTDLPATRAPQRDAIAPPEWAAFLIDCEIASQVEPVEFGWLLTSNVMATNLDFEWASNPDELGVQVKQVLESRFPVTVEVLRCDSNGQDWTVHFQAVVSSRIPNESPDAAFQRLAEMLGGDAKLGNFGGTLRVPEEGEAAEMLAVYYYDIVKSFCLTCSCTYRPLKAGGSSIRIVAGQRRSAAIVKRGDAESIDQIEAA